MTPPRSWLALGALLVAIVGGTVWAQQKKDAPPATVQALSPCDGECRTTTDKKCCDEKCSTKDEAKACCEGKCCTAEKGKCADGKCCGCCEKAKETRTISLPVPAGAAVQVTVEPQQPVSVSEGNYNVPYPTPPLPYATVPPVPCAAPPRPAEASWGSSWCPAGPPAPQPSVQYTPVTQYVATPCAVPPPAPAAALAPWQLRVVTINNQPLVMMQWQGDKDTRASSEVMTVHIGPEPLKVVVADKQLHVSGNFIKGSADTITRNTADGSLVMEGHVKVNYGKDGKTVEVAADEVVVGITDGRVEVRGLARAAFPAGLSAPKTGEIRPATTVPTSCPACPAGCDESHKALFNFWTGFFH